MVRGRNAEEQKLVQDMVEHGQGHLLRFWEDLGNGQKDMLVNDLRRIDLDWVKSVRHLLHEESHGRRTARVPEIIEIPRTSRQRKSLRQAYERGEALIQSGKTAAFTAAGGQSSRLGLETPKGTYPVTPVREKSLFQVHAEKIGFLQDKYGVSIPWLIMTSETNHGQTARFFEENGFFGLDPALVRFIEQGMYPALDGEGRMFLREMHRVFLGPTGHGGTFQTLNESGALKWLKKHGVEELFYFQVDNVLIDILDPVFLGHHLAGRCQMSSKCVMKRDPEEKIGVFVIEEGTPTVVEYSELDTLDLEDGAHVEDLKAGNVAIHLINIDFALQEIGVKAHLPLHVAHKAIPHVNDAGQKVKPTAPNGYKFEAFIFDALKYVQETIIMEVERSEEFSPLKNRTGEDSPETVFRDQLRLFASWFEDAGIRVPRDSHGEPLYKLEVSPRFAPTRTSFLERVDAGLVIEGDLYLA
jgi:UDP-N-acetylglucosamine/UDP-N-acetylgalactosamine diphosphorylase